MIRPTTPDDKEELIALASATGLFQPNQLEEVGEMLADYFSDNGDSDHFWITDDEDGPVGVAYCEPEPMTDQTWNLQLTPSDLIARDKDAARPCCAMLKKH